MFFVYNLALYFLAIIFSPVIFLAFIIKPKLRAGFFQKIGKYPKIEKKNKTIWVHAVSVGEVNAVLDFLKALRNKHPDYTIVLSTVTKTGFEMANSKLSQIVNNIIFFPYDFGFSVKSAIKNIDPNVVIIAETEIWPNFTNILSKRNIPIMLINGRISPNSYKGYKKISFFIGKILAKYTQILMQTDGDRERIINIGAPQNKTFTMGNLKLDISKPAEDKEIENIKKELKTENSIIITAGSTHKGEDEIILRIFEKLKSEHSNLKLLLAPRHPERNKSVESLIKESSFSYGKRSSGDDFAATDIILLDTIGELAKMYGISHIAFIGGSFSGTGGHNPLEAAIFDVPSVSGNIVFNFKNIYAYLTNGGASILVNNEEELYETFKKLIEDENFYKKASANCRKIFDNNRGAIDFALKSFDNIIE